MQLFLNSLIIISFKNKESKSLVFILVFVLDCCCMKGLDKHESQEKQKSRQSGMV